MENNFGCTQPGSLNFPIKLRIVLYRTPTTRFGGVCSLVRFLLLMLFWLAGCLLASLSVCSFLHSFVHPFLPSFRSFVHSFLPSFRSFLSSFVRSSVRPFVSYFLPSFFPFFVRSSVRSFVCFTETGDRRIFFQSCQNIRRSMRSTRLHGNIRCRVLS